MEIPVQSKTSYTWKTVIPEGSKVDLMVEDETGDEAWSGTVSGIKAPVMRRLTDIPGYCSKQ